MQCHLKENLEYRSWVEVDLGNFAANWAEMKRLVGPGVGIMQVVKADAYGHGAIEISNAALTNGGPRRWRGRSWSFDRPVAVVRLDHLHDPHAGPTTVRLPQFAAKLPRSTSTQFRYSRFSFGDIPVRSSAPSFQRNPESQGRSDKFPPGAPSVLPIREERESQLRFSRRRMKILTRGTAWDR